MGLLEEKKFPLEGLGGPGGRTLKLSQHDVGTELSRLAAAVQQDDDATVPTMKRPPKAPQAASPCPQEQEKQQQQQKQHQAQSVEQDQEQDEDDDEQQEDEQEDQEDRDEDDEEDEDKEGAGVGTAAQPQHSRDSTSLENAQGAGEPQPQQKAGRKRGLTSADKEHKRLKRLLRNRVSAQQARERKKVYLTDLEQRSKDLERKNAELEERVSTLQRENFMLRQVVKNTALQKAVG